MRESPIQSAIMLALGRGRSRIFRNNSGLAKYPNGSTVKYGVGNPGGSDLIGWTSVVVTPEMLGDVVAIFTAVEVKSLKGVASDDQLNFINAVLKAGGRAGIARSPDEALAIVERRQ